MLEKRILCLLMMHFLMGCGDVIVNDQAAGGTGGDATTGGAGAGSTSGGTGACATGEGFLTFGTSTDGATAGIAADASGVYWVNEDGSVWHAGPGGSAPEILANNLGKQLYTVAIDADAVYVVDYAQGVYRVGKKGGAVEPPALVFEGPAIGVAVDDVRIYVTDGSSVSAVGKQGGAAQLLAKLAGADSIALDADNVYVRTAGTTKDHTAHTLRVPKVGGMAVELASSEPIEYHYFSQELAVDDSHAYWLNSSAGTIVRAPKDGGAVETLATGIADPESLTLDEGFVSFTVRGKDGGSMEDRAVAKVPKTGGAISFLAHGAQVSAFGLAVDATHAYWTQRFVGGIVGAACK